MLIMGSSSFFIFHCHLSIVLTRKRIRDLQVYVTLLKKSYLRNPNFTYLSIKVSFVSFGEKEERGGGGGGRREGKERVPWKPEKK